MKIYEFLTEDISAQEAQRNLIDAFTTQIPDICRRLGAMAEKFAQNYTPKRHEGRYTFSKDSYTKALNFTLGSHRTNWYQDVFVPRVRPSVYMYARTLPHQLRQPILDYLGDDELNRFTEMIRILIPALRKAATATNNKPLLAAIAAASNGVGVYDDAVQRSIAKAIELNSDVDDGYESQPAQPKQPAAIGGQNVAVEQIINDVLSSLNKNVAGEIRNAISRSPNKLAALQQELNKRGIKP